MTISLTPRRTRRSGRDPTNIVGSAFGPLVSLAVAVILFDSGAGLDVRRLTGGTRGVVTRLIVLGVPITWAIAAFSAVLFLDMSSEAAVMLGAIVVVSGPTVVGPLLSFVRPSRRVQTVLAWEGSVIDPIGAILGTLTFHAIVAGGYEVGQLLASFAIGLAGGVVGTGVLFISISATVTPESVGDVLLPTLGLVAVLVVVARPLVALLATFRTGLSTNERAFIGWMAPRGIVAAATASTFSASLVSEGVGGASDILPATFLVIVATVTLYGLSAVPVARRLGVTRPAASIPLIVGGSGWVVALARALRAQGLDVLMWAGAHRQRRRIQEAGLPLAPGRVLTDAIASGARLEGITTVLLLTHEDDFNALAAAALEGTLDGEIYRVAPPSQDVGVVAPFTRGGTPIWRFVDGGRDRPPAPQGSRDHRRQVQGPPTRGRPAAGRPACRRPARSRDGGHQPRAAGG